MSYRDDVYISVKRNFEENAQKARRDADGRRRMLSLKYEDIGKVEGELSQTALSVFRAATMGKESLEERLAVIKNRNRELLGQRKELLVQYGYPENYFEPMYKCNVCLDSGSVNGQICDCMRKELNRKMLEISGLGTLPQKMNFKNFRLDYYNGNREEYENITVIFNAAKKFVKNFSDKENPSLLFMGNTGTGKTHLSVAIAAGVIKKGYYVVYNTAQNLFSDFEYDRFRRANNEEERSAKYFDCELLVIDDLGTENVNQFTTACLYNLVNTRKCEGKATIINTNLSQKDLRNKYDDRIFSRLAGEFLPYAFIGKDIRMKKLTE